MKNCLLFIFALILISCGENKPDQQKVVKTPKKDSVQKYDSLKWEELKINGEIPLFTNHSQIKMKFGKPDSISSKMAECGSFLNTDYKFLYDEGIKFEINADSAVFRSVDFRNSNIFLSINGIRLDKNTTTEDLQKYFPNSFTHQMEREVYGIGIVKSMQLYTNETFQDDLWLMFFDDKKLIRIDYWIGC